jgi:hypothetical protein
VVFAASRRSAYLEEETRLQMAAAAILDLMSEDMKGAFSSEGETPYLLGEDRWYEDRRTDRVQLVTTSTMPVSPMVSSGGLAEVGYVMTWSDDEEEGLLTRREQYPPEAPDDEGGHLSEVTRRITSLNIRYFDGDTWWDSWDSADEAKESMWGHLPVEVELELGLTDGSVEVTVRTRVAPVMAGGAM